MKYMKKIMITAFIAVMAMGQQALAQSQVKLTVYEGLSNTKLKTTIENEVSKLLTNINTAQASNSSRVDFTGISITGTAMEDVNKLWDNQHMMCPQKEVVERCLTLRNGYQIRNIPLVIINPETENTYQEAVINFDKNGTIVGYSFTINPELFTKLIKDETQKQEYEVWDIENRMEIINFVEQFRTSYNKKDINFLQQVFSDDALIITGRVVKQKGSEILPGKTDIQYFKQSKKEYLNRLRGTFSRSKYIKVDFEDMKIVKHPTKKDIYGVTVLQKWNSGSYSDEGYVFMMWDFRNKKKPQIHVRTWQPKYVDNMREIDPNDVFTLGSFDL